MAASSPTFAAMPLRCSATSGDSPWQLQVTLSNEGATPYVILRWHSPLDAWFSEFLQITQHGKPLPYQGAKAKRLQPSEEDLLILKPGQQHLELLELTQAYEIANAPLLVQFSPIAVMELKPNTPLVWKPSQQQWLTCADIVINPRITP